MAAHHGTGRFNPRAPCGSTGSTAIRLREQLSVLVTARLADALAETSVAQAKDARTQAVLERHSQRVVRPALGQTT
jgi:hypothetical protein